MISIIFLWICRTCWCWEREVLWIRLLHFFVKPMKKRCSRSPLVVLTSTWASIIICHFLTTEHILSQVRCIPWKLVRKYLPWTSSVISLNSFIILKISQTPFKYTTLQSIRGNLSSLTPGDTCLPNVSDIKHFWCFDIIPVVFGERINCFFSWHLSCHPS